MRHRTPSPMGCSALNREERQRRSPNFAENRAWVPHPPLTAKKAAGWRSGLCSTGRIPPLRGGMPGTAARIPELFMAHVLNPEQTESTPLNTELETPTLEAAAEQSEPLAEPTSNPENQTPAAQPPRGSTSEEPDLSMEDFAAALEHFDREQAAEAAAQAFDDSGDRLRYGHQAHRQARRGRRRYEVRRPDPDRAGYGPHRPAEGEAPATPSKWSSSARSPKAATCWATRRRSGSASGTRWRRRTTRRLRSQGRSSAA